MDEPDLLANAHRIPNAARPLLGLTILVVEDSRFASEAMRLLCLRSGARIRRADCLRSARRHLQIYRPSVVIIDMGLPDGSGADLIRELSTAVPRVAAVLGTSGDDNAETVAISAGADGFLAKPMTSLTAFQASILSHLGPERMPIGPRALSEDTITPDDLALQDDLDLIVEVLEKPADAETLDYVAQFLGGLARSAGDGFLDQIAADLTQARREGESPGPLSRHIAELIRARPAAKRVI
jgi:CheY-like chemotaxis protein